jgi:hypothetical protein
MKELEVKFQFSSKTFTIATNNRSQLINVLKNAVQKGISLTKEILQSVMYCTELDDFIEMFNRVNTLPPSKYEYEVSSKLDEDDFEDILVISKEASERRNSVPFLICSVEI